jgi:hypothetical protein
MEEGGILVAVELHKATADDARINHCAAMLLGLSKRMISRLGSVVVTLQERGVIPWGHMPFHYTDTDSVHTEKRYTDIIMKTYYEIFGEKVYYKDTHEPGEKKKAEETDEEYEERCFRRKKFLEEHPWMVAEKFLGVFHPDFDVPAGVKKEGEIVSRRSVFAGKKMYCHELVMKGDREGEETVWYHERLKGIPNSSIHMYLRDNAEKYPNSIELFKDIARGKEFRFNLLSGGKVSFVHTPSDSKGLRIQTRAEMYRTTRRTDDVANLTREEAKKAFEMMFGPDRPFQMAGTLVECPDI